MYSLKDLKIVTNNILLLLRKNRPYVLLTEPINWADLRCVMAEYTIGQDGNSTHRVYIEEASPTCPEFQHFIAGKLDELGFRNVEVVTEW